MFNHNLHFVEFLLFVYFSCCLTYTLFFWVMRQLFTKNFIHVYLFLSICLSIQIIICVSSSKIKKFWRQRKWTISHQTEVFAITKTETNTNYNRNEHPRIRFGLNYCKQVNNFPKLDKLNTMYEVDNILFRVIYPAQATQAHIEWHIIWMITVQSFRQNTSLQTNRWEMLIMAYDWLVNFVYTLMRMRKTNGVC